MKSAHMKKFCLPAFLGLLLLPGSNASLHGQQALHPSIRETVAGVIARLKREIGPSELQKLTATQAEQLLTPQEREILGTEHLTFRVNVPVRVTVLRDMRLGTQPFWLSSRGFHESDIKLRQGKVMFDAWQREFPAGPVGLGVHSLGGGGDHYLVTLAPQQPGDQVKVTDLYPPELQIAAFKAGAEPYIDQPDTLASVPPELEGQLVRWCVPHYTVSSFGAARPSCADLE
jgi:acid phosphatase type 7